MKILIAVLLLILALGAAALVRTLTIRARKSDYVPPRDDPRALPYAEKLSRMVKYDTTSYPNTDQRETFLGYHKILEELFPLVHARLDKTEIGGSLLYHWKGKSDKYPVVLMGHQDVVPVSGEWTKPPFSGEISEGKVWGRGSVDTKCSCMAFFQPDVLHRHIAFRQKLLHCLEEAMQEHFVSTEPRPQTFPSEISPENGGLDHSPETGTTSWCPISTTGYLSSFPFQW